MKLNVANPENGLQKLFEVENENDLRIFYDKTISSEIEVSSLGPQWKGYVLKITGGQDKQGFPMKQGVLTNSRVKLLLNKGTVGCRGFSMKNGERSRKSVRGCLVSPEISVLNLVITKEGSEITGLTGGGKSKKLNLKRSSKIRKTFCLTKEDDLRKFVINEKKKENGKPKNVPKIQRLVTPITLQRERSKIMLKKKRFKKTRSELLEYGKILSKKE
mmetsp:Transcript_49627/g.117044  ORF Transcript_49627/g.117044 Transcript_49627/m.117044 type:complete len:217 (+) Transcript_49627:67-717(+)